MLRKMCKECAKADRDYYGERRKTGEVIKIETVYGRSLTTVRCSACGREWHYKGKQR